MGYYSNLFGLISKNTSTVSYLYNKHLHYAMKTKYHSAILKRL